MVRRESEKLLNSSTAIARFIVVESFEMSAGLNSGAAISYQHNWLSQQRILIDRGLA
jgi:hypothetical protein